MPTGLQSTLTYQLLTGMKIFHRVYTLNSIVRFFYNIIYDCLEKYVPLVFNVSGNGSKRNGFCYPPSVRKLMRKKLAAWYRYKKFRTPNCLFRFKHISVERREACFAARARHEEKIVEPGNIGKFFRYANSKLNARHNVGPLRKSDPAIKAELLSIYFSSVFTTDNGSCVTASANKTSGNISNITFTEQQVSRAISKLKANSAGGPDDIPPFFQKLSF